MTRADLYLWCLRQGMTQAETARHCGVSAVTVHKFARREGVSFSRIPLAVQQLKRKLEMRYYRYPWEEMEVGDYVDAGCTPSVLAHKATVLHFPKRFRGYAHRGCQIVARVA